MPVKKRQSFLHKFQSNEQYLLEAGHNAWNYFILHFIAFRLPFLETWLPNTGAWTNCYWASKVKRSLPVTPDMLAWSGLTEHRVTIEAQNRACSSVFSLLIRPERVTLGLHAWLKFHYPPCRSERHKPDCLCFKSDVSTEWRMGERWRYRKGEWKETSAKLNKATMKAWDHQLQHDSGLNKVRKIYGLGNLWETGSMMSLFWR